MSREHRREVRHGLARASLPYQALVDIRSEMEMVSWAESDDGYRPAGEGMERVSRSYLVLPAFKGENGRMYRKCTFRTPATTREGLVEAFRQELAWAEQWMAAEELAAETAEDAAAFEALLQEEHEPLFLREKEAIEGGALEQALDSAMARFRRHVARFALDSDPRWSEPTRTYPVTAESVERYVRALRMNLQVVEEAIVEGLRLKGEVEIAAAADAAAKKAAFEAAMAAPAGEAKWYLDGTDAEVLAFTGRTLGQGFGLKVADTHKYLPGGRSPVAIKFHGRTRRYHSYISSVGLDEVWSSLPTSVGKQDVTLLGLVADPGWSVAVRHTHDGDDTEWGLYTAEGITTLQAPGWDGEERWTFRGWDGEEGKGPSKAALRLAHGLAASKEEPPPPPAPLAVPATLGGLMGKWGKKR